MKGKSFFSREAVPPGSTCCVTGSMRPSASHDGTGTGDPETQGRPDTRLVLGLIPPYRWNFQAMAAEDSELLEFDGSIILAPCEGNSGFSYALLKHFAALMSEQLDRARQKMMDQWDPPGAF